MFRPAHRKAQLLTMDLLLALVPLTIALSMSANAISGVTSQIQEYAYFYSMQRQANDAADVLVKTPGEPPNWNSAESPTIAGLAKYGGTLEIENELDLSKIMAVSNSNIVNLIGTSNFNLTMTTANGTLLRALGVAIPSNATDIFVAERGFFIDPAEALSGITLLQSPALSRLKKGSSWWTQSVYNGTFTINSSNFPGYNYYATVSYTYQQGGGNVEFNFTLNSTQYPGTGTYTVPDTVDITGSITGAGDYGVGLYLGGGSWQNQVKLTITAVPVASDVVLGLMESSGICRLRLMVWR